jgi:cytochrome c peroxidase
MKSFYQILLLIPILFSCQKEEPIISPVNSFTFDQPAHFPKPVYSYANNALTKEWFELGRFLFYDPILSLDSSISCSSCHAQPHGFADHNIPLSKGVNGKFGKRNAPALMNLAWSPTFMWDGGVNHLEVQPLVPLTDEHEMGESMANLVVKLNKSSFYKQKFKEAFGIETITDQKLLHALAQFTSMLVSANSKYDQVKLGKANFTEKEQRGYQLFKSYCNSCHTEPLFTNYSYRNSGLEKEIIDIGRERITQDPADRGKFKVPTLRNVEFTYPYMHDGRFANLREVVKFKTNGIQISSTTDPLLINGFPLSSDDQLDLVEFLKTLSDFSYIGSVKYAEPIR